MTSEWKPIETAPQDQPVLIFIPDWDVKMVVAEKWHDTWYEQTNEAVGEGCTSPDIKPTHWMPLPEAPQ